MKTLTHWLWLWAYRLEEMRQSAAAAGYLWTQAGVCVLLSILRLWK